MKKDRVQFKEAMPGKCGDCTGVNSEGVSRVKVISRNLTDDEEDDDLTVLSERLVV